MAVFNNNLLAAAGAQSGTTTYAIDQSIRFNNPDSPYMSRTPSSAGNRRTFTISFWIKRGNPATSTGQQILNAYQNSSNRFQLFFDASVGVGTTGDKLTLFNVSGGTTTSIFETTQLFRDHSAWYHFVISIDTTNAVASERVRLYVNGSRVTDFSTQNNPSLNYDMEWNNNQSHIFGEYGGGGYHLDAYLAEIVNIDGYAYDPSFFGEFNDSGIWIPKRYTGSYGTNGFKIDGRDSSDLGDDESGNGNDFTTSGMDASDQKADTPTNNQITFNPLNNQRSGGSPSNGNLDYVGPGTRTNISLTANIPSTGKWAVAYKVGQVSTNSGWQIGLSTANDSDFGDAAGSNEDLDLCRLQPSSSNVEVSDKINNTYITPSPALPITTSDEFWVVVDMDTGNIFLGIYDASDTTMKFIAADGGLDGDPSTGANPTITSTTTSMPRDNVVFSVGSKQTNQYIYLQRSTDVSGTTPTGYTYFENVKDLI